jgi:hypothetical protein
MSDKIPTKAELKATLDKRGVKYSADATNEELKKLVEENPEKPEGAIGAATAGDGAAPTTGEKPEGEEKKNSNNVKAIDIVCGDTYVQTYSEKVHGSDFKKMAKDLVAKKSKKYKAVDSSSVKKVTVTFEHINKQKELVKVVKEFGSSVEEKSKAKDLAAFHNVEVKIA